MAFPKSEFALYRGDELLALGTADQIAEQTGISRSTVLFYGTPSYKKRMKSDDALALIRIEDDEEEGNGEV